MRLDIRNFNPFDVPRTKALAAQQILSTDSTTQWALDSVMNGTLTPDDEGGGFATRHTSAKLYGCYVDHVTKIRKRPISAVEFGRWLSECGFQRSLVGGRAAWDIPAAQERVSRR